MFAEDQELVMLFQILPDLLTLFVFSLSSSLSVTREVNLSYLHMALFLTVGTDSTCVKTEM